MGEDLPPYQESVEQAAIRPSDERPELSAEREAEIDQALRARNPRPPLTEEEIARLTAHRGKRPTQEEIDGINRAREQDIHTGRV